MLESDYINPIVDMSPQIAFYAEKTSLPLDACQGKVCCEFVMCYPPGIPILAPGERVTKEIIEYIKYARNKGCMLTGPESMNVSKLNILKG